MKGGGLDDIDKSILNILTEDSRRSHRSIATDLNKTPITIKRHLDKLEKEKIIKKYTVDIDYEKIGYSIIALIEITISKGKMLEVEQDIAQNPNVFGVYDITGQYDALLIARFKTRNELSGLVKKINSHENVIRTNTHLILNVIKEDTSFEDLMENEEKNKKT